MNKLNENGKQETKDTSGGKAPTTKTTKQPKKPVKKDIPQDSNIKIYPTGTKLRFKGFININVTKKQFEENTIEEMKKIPDSERIETIEWDGTTFQSISFKLSQKDEKKGVYLNSPNIQANNPQKILDLKGQMVDAVVEVEKGEWKGKPYNRFKLKQIKPLYDYSDVVEDVSAYKEYEAKNIKDSIDDEDLPF